jgi:hypothetical protein
MTAFGNPRPSSQWFNSAADISSYSWRILSPVYEEVDKKGKNPVRNPLRALAPTKRKSDERE